MHFPCEDLSEPKSIDIQDLLQLLPLAVLEKFISFLSAEEGRASWNRVQLRTPGFQHKASISPMESLSEPLLLSSVYLAVLSIGLLPTQGRRRKKMGGILPKTAKLQSPEKFSVWRKHSISQKQTAALQCLHRQLGKVWRAANQQKTLDLFEQVLDASLNLVLIIDSVF